MVVSGRWPACGPATRATMAAMSRPPLRLLAVCPYAADPPDGGGKLRIQHLLQEWMRQGHEVTIWVVPLDEPTLTWPEGPTQPRSIRAFPAQTRRSLGSKIRSLISAQPEEAWTRTPPDDWSELDIRVTEVAPL